MKVEKLIGTSPSSTFADLKNASRNDFFTHKVTFDYTDYTPTTDALTAAVHAPIFKNASGATKGLLKGCYIKDVVCYIKTAFAGIANQNGETFDFGYTGGSVESDDVDNFIDAFDAGTAGGWEAFAAESDSSRFGMVAPEDLQLTGTLTCTVSSGTEKLNELTAGELEIYLHIVNMNDLLTEGAWATVTL